MGSDPPEAKTNLEGEISTKSISGKELPANWPQILTQEEEAKAYEALRDEGDNLNLPPKNPHIERLSYELTSKDKRLRFFATYHQRDMKDLNDPNILQYEILERKFRESPPQLVLYEGLIDDVSQSISREQALSLGEPAWMMYLVQQYNANLKDGEKPIVIESGDASVNLEANQNRDKYIVKNAAKKFKDFDKIDIVFGSGHAIRERQAWEEFFD